MNLQHVRLVLALVGVLVWAYGYRTENDTVRWIAIAIIAVAVLLRFSPSRSRTDTTTDQE